MSKPNIVFILADDLGYGDLSCYGAVTHTTPNCDRLAAAGVRFTDAHAPSAVCTPSRYGILTGRYCWRGSLKRGVLGGTSEPLIERERPTVASFLRDQGYVTACIGKWHLGLGWARAGEAFDFAAPLNQGPLDHGFDQFFGIAASLDMPPYVFIENDRTLGVPDRPKEPLDFSQKHRGGTMVEGWRDDLVNRRHTERAVEFIASQRDAPAPFFLYLATTGPHTPWSPAPEFAGKSGIGPRGDMILEFDWTVGRIMDALAENGLADDTLLIVTSDNGPHPFTEEITRHRHKPAADLRGQKADIWDGGHRVPLIARWPGHVSAGAECAGLVCLIDLFATCADLLGCDQPADGAQDSRSLLPLLHEPEGAAPRESVVHHSLDGMFALRRTEYKLIAGRGSGGFKPPGPQSVIGMPGRVELEQTGEAPGQLYDMLRDPSERMNVYAARADIVAAMERELSSIKGDSG